MLDDWPAAGVFPLLFGIAAARGGSIYLLARGARAAGDRSRGGALLSRPAVGRAERLVLRYGAPVVTLGFLTVGVQSAINAAAGALRMPLRRYLVALTLGALLWAAVYTTVGMAVVYAFWGRLDLRWALAGAAGLGTVLACTAYLRRRWRRTATVPGDAGQERPHDTADATPPRIDRPGNLA